MKILLVASPGGHLSELKALQEAWQGHEAYWVSYRGPTTGFCDQVIDPIGTNFFSLIKSFFVFFNLVRHLRPQAVISTGSEIALPAMFWGKLMGARTLYIECSARVKTASLTGRLLQFWVDDFWVQWPQALMAFGSKAQYRGGTL